MTDEPKLTPEGQCPVLRLSPVEPSMQCVLDMRHEGDHDWGAPAVVPSRESTLPELDELLKAARAATPGPWRKEPYGDDFIVRDANGIGICDICTLGTDEQYEVNTDFISLANPTAILELISEIRKLRTPHDDK